MSRILVPAVFRFSGEAMKAFSGGGEALVVTTRWSSDVCTSFLRVLHVSRGEVIV